MNQTKTLTVVIPTYNMEKYLRRCLNSLILPQEQMDRLEVLVINDGSKDSSSAIAHEYQDKYPRTFRVIDKENGNWGSCINRGIKEATGKYLRLLDSDDRYDTNALIKLINSLENTDADMVFTHYCLDFGDHIDYRMLSNTIKFGQIYQTEKFVKRISNFMFQMHAITFKRSIINDVKLTLQEGISYTDTEFIFYPLAAVKTILPLNICLYYWTWGREGQTSAVKAMKKSLNDRYKTTIRVLNDYIKDTKTGKAQKYYQAALVALTLGEYYATFLLYLGKNEHEKEESRGREMCTAMKAHAPELLERCRKWRYAGYLPYFAIWERTGKHMTDFPYNILAPLCKFANTNVNRAKKLVKLLLGMPVSNTRPIHKDK